MSDPTTLKLTYEDYLGFPDDLNRHEILDGEHAVTPAPTPRHQKICINLIELLARHCRERGLGEVFTAPIDVVLSETDVVQPDLCFVAAARHHLVTPTHIAGPPDLMVEIASPGTRRRDEVTKRRLYEKFGVGEYWIVDPEVEEVKVWRRGAPGYSVKEEYAREGGEVVRSPLFPDLVLPLEEILRA